MQNNESTLPKATAGESGASAFLNRFPPVQHDLSTSRYGDRLQLGPREAWVCDRCGRETSNGSVVFSDPSNPRLCPQGDTCVVRVFCAKHQPRSQAYSLPLREFRSAAAVWDSLRQLSEKPWFNMAAFRELGDRFLRGLHVAPSAR